MIELWDTSALILAARHPVVGRVVEIALEADEVAICEPIAVEYLNGARNLREYDEYATALRALRVVTTEAGDWARVLDVHHALADSGPGHQRSVRLVDLIIAAVAERHGLPVVHYDADFDRVAAVTGQATRWVIERGSV